MLDFKFSNGEIFENVRLEDKSFEEEFRAYLTRKKLESKENYISSAKKIFDECIKNGILFSSIENPNIFSLTNIDVLRNICYELNHGALESFNKKSFNRAPHACIMANYIPFLRDKNQTITFTQEEKELFAKALKELIFEVDECVARDKRTKQDKISHAGTSSKQIKEYLSFLKNYGVDYQVGIGNSWGFLNQDSWIIFAPQKILGENLVNGSTLAPTRGVYAYFSYFGYLQNERGYGLYFGFPNGDKNQEHGDPNKSRCVAVRKMQKDNALQTYNFTYESLDLEKITQDFESMMNYFNQFSSSDFVAENMEIDTQETKQRFWLYKAGNNGDKWEEMYVKGLMGIGWRELGDLREYPNKEEIEKALNRLYPTDTTNRMNDRKSNWDFCNEVQIGDIVIVGNGRNKFMGYGEVKGEYFYNPNLDDDFASFRKIKWLKKGEWFWENNSGWAIKALTDITQYSSPHHSLLTQIGFYNQNDIQSNTPLNQILYGSPATGKTYNTIDRALEILGIDCKDKTREERKKIFEDYRQKGQIEFITFHQSYGYEEFVEGIKPIEENGNITYKVEGGIFKKIVDKATEYSDFDKFYQYLLDNPRTLQSKEGAPLYFETNKQGTLIANFTNGEKQLPISREKFKTIFDCFKNKESNFYSMSNMTNKMKEIVGIGIPATSYWAMMNHYFKEYCKPYILIIDEINRGNISKIFGELITLIEPSKRIGESEELKVKLPYSQDEFGVPSNLYIIGTMNTADRSITSLDTALRRRFEFVEMMPDSNKLKNLRVHKDNKDTGIELCDMLEQINKRIEFLYDREKTIGHAFFLSEDKENQGFITLEQLKGIFQNKIIPLLQEYFYNDYALIQAVLNDNGMIKGEKQKPDDLFSSQALINELDLEAKKMYSITSDENIWNDEDTYIKIYETSKSQNSDEGN